MIRRLSGQITGKGGRFLVVETGGIGYKVFVTTDTLLAARDNEKRAFHTHLAVREDALDLYGFNTSDELSIFELLISISGIGPKSALSILSAAGPDILRKAVQAGDISYLTKVSGIGRKSADKIILELKDKFGEGEMGAPTGEDADMMEALKTLGYSLYESREALKRIPPEIIGTTARIKEALRILSKG